MLCVSLRQTPQKAERCGMWKTGMARLSFNLASLDQGVVRTATGRPHTTQAVLKILTDGVGESVEQVACEDLKRRS